MPAQNAITLLKAELGLDMLGKRLAARKKQLQAELEQRGLPMPGTVTLNGPPLEQRALA